MSWLVRFVYGGLVAVATWQIGKHFGPVIGGLFLAFPSILPATVTLVKQGEGRLQARDEGAGAVLGSVGLGGFGAVVWRFSQSWPPWGVLLAATATWLGLSLGSWAVCALLFPARWRGVRKG